MASVTIKRGTEAEVASTAITDGQILFTTDREYNNQIMADVGEERILIGGNNIFTGTQAEYEEALSQGLIFEGMQVNITDDYDRDLESQNIPYDNTDSGLSATNVKDAIDEIQSEMGNSYATTDTVDTTIASADKIPFYDESATAKKNITLDNFVDTIAPNFGSQISTSQGNMLDLLDKDGNLMDSVVIQTKANNVSYTDTYNIGETDMQGALDKTIEDVASQSVASGVSYTDTNNIGATNVQSAVDKLFGIFSGKYYFYAIYNYSTSGTWSDYTKNILQFNLPSEVVGTGKTFMLIHSMRFAQLVDSNIESFIDSPDNSITNLANPRHYGRVFSQVWTTLNHIAFIQSNTRPNIRINVSSSVPMNKSVSSICILVPLN